MIRWADILRCWARVTGKMFLLPLAGKLLHHGLEEGEHFLGFTQGIPFDAEGSSLIHVYDATFYVPPERKYGPVEGRGHLEHPPPEGRCREPSTNLTTRNTKNVYDICIYIRSGEMGMDQDHLYPQKARGRGAAGPSTDGELLVYV